MSDDLQNDEVETEVIESAEVENQEIESELDTDSGLEHEQAPEVDEEAVKQDAIQKAINKKHFETQQAKRDLDAANKRIADFEAEKRAQEAARVGNIPDKPDAFDDDYEDKMEARDKAIAAQATFNAQNQGYEQQQANQQQQAQVAQQQEVQTQVTAYNARTKELGISTEEMQAAGNAVAQYGMSNDLTMAILGDSDGPLITKYLAANPVELSNLTTMNPVQAAMHIERTVRAKATALKPKTTNAPKPGNNLSGNGAKPSTTYKNIGGATFT
tara:strand:- start:821 stop:1636 length:816 start_codon:yes stop_codon:yes gene_type:complete